MEQQIERWTFLIAVVIAILWTWPLAIQPDLNPSLHFDAYGLLWLIEGVQHVSNNLFFHSNYPYGQNIGHSDSWLFYGLCLLSHRVLPPTSLLAFVFLFGITTNIWTMTRCAQEWGVRGFSALAAGCLFGLNGLVLNAILEGAYYLTWLAWLPGVAWAIHRYAKVVTWPNAMLIVIAWTGALLTSAYLGIVASIVLILLSVHLMPRKRSLPWSVRIYLPILLIGGFYVLAFLSTNTHRAHDFVGLSEDWISMGVSNVWNLLFWHPDIDSYTHSLGPVSNIFLILMIMIMPFYRVSQHWSIWWMMAIIHLGLSFGFRLAGSDTTEGIPWILWMFQDWSIVSFFHFPVRFHWGVDLAGSLLLGLTLQRAQQYRSWIPQVAFLVVVIHCTFIQGAWFRQSNTVYHSPAIYHQTTGTGALLELYQIFSTQSDIEPLLVKNVLCSQQIYHHKPLLMECMGTTTAQSNDWKVRSILLADIFDAQSLEWQTALPKLGIDTLIVHLDWFESDDAQHIDQYLRSVLGAPVISNDGSVLHWTFDPIEQSHDAILNHYNDLYSRHL